MLFKKDLTLSFEIRAKNKIKQNREKQETEFNMIRLPFRVSILQPMFRHEDQPKNKATINTKYE